MSPESHISAHSFNRDIAPVNSKGEVVCYKHLERARRFTSHTPLNPGRDFYACSKDRNDPERCQGFFVWADDRALRTAQEWRRAEMQNTAANMHLTTPRRPSQAQRAQMARSPNTPISPQKRRRTPSPPPPFPCTVRNPHTPKQRRVVDGRSSDRTRPTPVSTPESRAARDAAIEQALKEQSAEMRLKSIEEALSAVASHEKEKMPSGSSRLPQTPSRSSQKDPIEEVLEQFQNQRCSDGGSTSTPPSPLPSSASQNRAPLHRMAQPYSSQPSPPFSQATQSDAGHSITDEVQQADIEDEDEIEDPDMAEPEPDLEDKAIQTDPIESDDDDEYFDERSVIDDLWSSQPPHSAVGSPVSSIPFTLPATAMEVDDDDDAHFGSGRSRSEQEPERASWPSPARLPPQTPTSRRAGSSRGYASGGNASEVDGGRLISSMLLTPPGSSHTAHGSGPSSSATCRGRDGVLNPVLRERQGPGRDLSPSPSPSKGKGREVPRSQWQMIQDDPENPFHERAAALRADSRTSSTTIDATSEAESQSQSQSLFGSPQSAHRDPLSAEFVEQQIASLGGLPEYIRRLERRERAAQKSAEIKARKIAQLDEEVQRLRNANRALEETVAALQVRR